MSGQRTGKHQRKVVRKWQKVRRQIPQREGLNAMWSATPFCHVGSWLKAARRPFSSQTIACLFQEGRLAGSAFAK